MTNDEIDFGPMTKIGVMLNNLERDRLAAWQVLIEEGYPVVHTNAIPEAWLTGPQGADYVAVARRAQAQGVQIHTMFIGFDGQDYTDIDSVARTVGILPIAHLRRHRIDIAKKYCDLAKELNVSALAMHLGFMPNDPDSADYQFLIEAVREIADTCERHGQSLHLETGQESADELKRFIVIVDRPNLGANFDCGNFVLYGTDEPLNALNILGPRVRGVHCKDGFPPTEPGKLGKEVPLGHGKVDFPQFLADLRKLGYSGPLIIERESGPDVRREIREGKEYLEALIAAPNA